jgi:hypothetical protein
MIQTWPAHTEPEFKLLKSLRIDSKVPIPVGCVAWRADSYSYPSPHSLIDCLKNPAQWCRFREQKIHFFGFVFSRGYTGYHYVLWAWLSTCICSEKLSLKFPVRVSSFLAFLGNSIKFFVHNICKIHKIFDNFNRVISQVINFPIFLCRGSASLSTLARLAARSVTPAGSSTASSTVRILANQKFVQIIQPMAVARLTLLGVFLL